MTPCFKYEIAEEDHPLFSGQIKNLFFIKFCSVVVIFIKAFTFDNKNQQLCTNDANAHQLNFYGL